MWVLLEPSDWSGDAFVGCFDSLEKAKEAIPLRVWTWYERGREWRTVVDARTLDRFVIREYTVNTLIDGVVAGGI